MTSPLLRTAILTAIYGTASTLALSPATALAQSASDGAASELETITVVGSRIKRTDIETSQPVFVLEREDLQKTGLSSVGDILQDLTTSGSALNTTFNNGGNGSTQVSLRNLGANRTLVLVNGRRWVTGLTGAVDLNTIPVAIIERIEVLKDGASAIYGSDAIAGVINITTRDTYDGAEASAYLGENEEGDGRTESYDFTIGSSTDRASVVLNASYVKQEPIMAGDREISAVPLIGFNANNVTAGASSTTPFGQFGFGNGGQLPNGAAGTLTLTPGRRGNAVGDFKPFDPNVDGYNFSPDNYLLTPQERVGVYAQARYQLTDSVGFSTTVLYNERRSEQQLAAIPFVLGTIAGGIAADIEISRDSIYNPFGADVTRAQFRNTTKLRSFNQDVDTFYFTSGFDGAFDLADRSFSWDANYIYTDNERRDVTTGQFDLNRLRDGLGASFVDANGVARCGTPTAVIAGCVPLNLMGGPDGFTREMADYASVTLQDTQYDKMYSYTANLTGDLFELPAGPLGMAAGYEYRRVFGFDQPDAITASGATTGNARARTEGGYSLDEVYVEFNVPILADMAFADVFEVSVATRYSDYSNFGETMNPKFGFRWKPFADLLVRGNYAKGFRAPSVTELFQGLSDSFQSAVDPCSRNAAPSGAVATRCFQGFGGVAPVPTGYQQANSQIRATVGGNPDLAPEAAVSKTLGLVYSPSWLEGLDLYLDWYNVKIEDAIGSPSAQFLLNDCYINANVASCATITRAAGTGNVTALIARSQNNPGTLGLETEGYDFTANYRFDTELGRFAINWDNAYISYTGDIDQPERGDVLSNGVVSLGNQVGLLAPNGLAQWRLRSTLSTNWSLGDWGATVTGRYRSNLDENCNKVIAAANALGDPSLRELCSGNPDIDPQFSRIGNRIDDVWYFDVQGTYDLPWNARVIAGIKNVGDKDPPVAYSAFANSFDPQYDVPGRFWYVQYTQRF